MRRMIGIRSGFTLVEILVSLMIFSIVSSAMIGLFFTATDIYRRGEASRSANDEAIAVLAAIEDDLARMVPASSDGFLRTSVLHNGSMIIGFVANNPDAGDRRVVKGEVLPPTQTIQTPHLADPVVIGPLQILFYWTDQHDRLHRAVISQPLPTKFMSYQKKIISVFMDHEDAIANKPEDPDFDSLPYYQTLTPRPSPELSKKTSIIAEGCLLLSAAISMPPTNGNTYRDFDARWEPKSDGKLFPRIIPNALTEYDSAAHGMGESICLRVVLTGGNRFAPQGFVIEDDGNTIRIGGISKMPSLPGSYARIGDNPVKYNDPALPQEWVAYRLPRPGELDLTDDSSAGVGRGRLFTTKRTAQKGEAVRIGQPYSLVRALPR